MNANVDVRENGKGSASVRECSALSEAVRSPKSSAGISRGRGMGAGAPATLGTVITVTTAAGDMFEVYMPVLGAHMVELVIGALMEGEVAQTDLKSRRTACATGSCKCVP